MSIDETRGKPVLVTAGAGVPLHRQLFLVLHDEIARGAYRRGTPFPRSRISAISSEFPVSPCGVHWPIWRARATSHVARVWDRLCGNLIRPRGEQIASRSYGAEMRQIQFESEVDVFEFGLRTPPTPSPDKVKLVGEALYVLAVRRERRTGEPLLGTEAWLPGRLAENITAEKMAHTPMFTLLADAGVTFTRLQHEFTCEIAGPRNARLLDIAIGAPVLRINRTSFTEGDQPHHYLSILLSPNRSRVLLSHSVHELETGPQMAILHDVRPER